MTKRFNTIDGETLMTTPPTYDHRYILPMALAIGFLIITGAYFLMYHVFNAQGVVSVIIEMFGGITFLIVILRKGTL